MCACAYMSLIMKINYETGIPHAGNNVSLPIMLVHASYVQNFTGIIGRNLYCLHVLECVHELGEP